MEEKKATSEEAFFNAKSELEQLIVAQLRDFAGKFATSVIFKGCIEVQPLFANDGQIIETRISHVEVETKYSQG